MPWVHAPERLQRLLRTLHEIGSCQDPIAEPWAYLVDDHGPGAQKDGIVLAEVHRPGGEIISALAGPWVRPEPIEFYSRNANHEKGRASDANDWARLHRCEDAERAYLGALLDPWRGDGKVRPVVRAVRLRQLLLRAADATGQETAWRDLMEELLHREFPFLLMTNASGHVAHMTFPGGASALPAYPDEQAFGRAVADLAAPRAPVVMAAMGPRELFDWAASAKAAVALNVYRDPSSPLYAFLTSVQVAALASGEKPAAKS